MLNERHMLMFTININRLFGRVETIAHINSTQLMKIDCIFIFNIESENTSIDKALDAEMDPQIIVFILICSAIVKKSC